MRRSIDRLAAVSIVALFAIAIVATSANATRVEQHDAPGNKVAALATLQSPAHRKPAADAPSAPTLGTLPLSSLLRVVFVASLVGLGVSIATRAGNRRVLRSRSPPSLLV